jgi:hypothetical protein
MTTKAAAATNNLPVVECFVSSIMTVSAPSSWGYTSVFGGRRQPGSLHPGVDPVPYHQRLQIARHGDHQYLEGPPRVGGSVLDLQGPG